MQDYMMVENTDIFSLIESLKDSEFIYKHAHINEQLSSFEFPNLKSRLNFDSKQKYIKLLEKSVPKFDSKMHQLILKTPDPAEQIVGIIIPSNSGGLTARKNDSMELSERTMDPSNISRVISSNQGRIRSEKKQTARLNVKKQYSDAISTPSD